MVAELNVLRDKIDRVDKALLNLLAKRLSLVGEVKSRAGLPIYAPIVKRQCWVLPLRCCSIRRTAEFD